MPVFAPYSYIVEHVVLPHTPFGYPVMITEASLGAFLTLVGMSGSLDYLGGRASTLSFLMLGVGLLALAVSLEATDGAG